MFRPINYRYIKPIITGSILVVYFLYFGLFNKYHIQYLEQEQLFRFRFDYLKEFLSLPGSLPLYAGSFFTQFFISPLAGALIVTLNALALFLLFDYIVRKHNVNNIFLSMVPVWLLSILQSSEIFSFGQAIGIMLVFLFFAFYISKEKYTVRYLIFFPGWPLFYLVAGGFAIPALILCVVHEVFFRKDRNHLAMAGFMILTGIAVPFIFSKFLYYLPTRGIFTYPLATELRSYSLYALILLLLWLPLVLLSAYFLKKVKYFRTMVIPVNPATMVAGIAAFLLMGLFIYKFAYNRRAELMLGIDHHVQKTEWEKALEISSGYPDLNTLVIYYTNLALANTGQLSQKMFFYPQAGQGGLRLKWERNANLFFGGDVFYYLSYINEANRWAFESMVARGLNPRSLKRLVMTNLINGDYPVASKYLNKLGQTLFYRKWASHYMKYITNPALAEKDPEISKHRRLLISDDFISRTNSLNLDDLLNNHPDNKMAFEFLIATVLLDKNLDKFAEFIPRLTYYDYTSIPLHFEEALIFYNSYENKNILPEGFSYRPETMRSFRDYATTYSTYRSNMIAASSQLKKKYANSFWYYLQFNNSIQ